MLTRSLKSPGTAVVVEIIVAILLAIGGFLAGRNYERKHPTTEEEANAVRAVRDAFFKKDK